MLCHTCSQHRPAVQCQTNMLEKMSCRQVQLGQKHYRLCTYWHTWQQWSGRFKLIKLEDEFSVLRISCLFRKFVWFSANQNAWSKTDHVSTSKNKTANQCNTACFYYQLLQKLIVALIMSAVYLFLQRLMAWLVFYCYKFHFVSSPLPHFLNFPECSFCHNESPEKNNRLGCENFALKTAFNKTVDLVFCRRSRQHSLQWALFPPIQWWRHQLRKIRYEPANTVSQRFFWERDVNHDCF